MSASVAAQVLALESMNIAQLRVRWNEVFGQETKQRNRRYLIKRLAWKLQEDQLPRLTADQEARVAAYQREYESMQPEEWFPRAGRRSAKNPSGATRQLARDPRLPPAGAVVQRRYKGQDVVVKIIDTGFEFEGRAYRSLSAIAREVTGTTWNGYAFFKLDETKEVCGRRIAHQSGRQPKTAGHTITYLEEEP